MTDWAKLKVVDLKAELKRRGLQQHGLKTELVARLVEVDEEQTREEDAGEPEVENDDVPMADDPPEPRAESVAPDAEAVEKPATEDAEATEETNQAEPAENGEPDANKGDGSAGDTGEQQQQPETIKNGEPSEAPEEVSNPAADVPIPGKEAGGQSREPTVEQASRAATTNAASPHSLEATPAAERQKRKRRSLTPPPTEEAIARKRARADEPDTANGDSFPEREEKSQPQAEEQEEPAPMNIDNEQQQPLEQDQATAPEPEPVAPREETPTEKPQEMDYERDVAPSVHPATPALYIKNLMRPLRPQDVKAHLVNLATPSRDPLDDDIVVEFFLDQIRTHAFVIFRTTTAASRARNALHDTVWPNESNRKPLLVDFVPPEQVRDWIETEHASGGPRGRSGTRWEIVYEDGPDGAVEAHLEEASSAMSRAGPPPGPRQPSGPSMMGGDSVPLGPRGYRDPTIPTGPRPVRPGTGPGPRPPPTNLGGDSKRTNTRPVIYYQTVSEDLASRRIDNMRSFYSTDRDRDVGREINRYSFEDGASFVDRGKEVFEGIRPPHRERAVERERRGGRRRGRGGGGRPRSDRYLPPPRGGDRQPSRLASESEDTRMRDSF